VTISAEQKDPLFHGHVNRPGVFLFAYVLGGIVVIVMFVLLAEYVFFWAEQNEKVTTRQVVFESYFMEAGDTYLVSSDDLLFEVSGKWKDMDSLKYVCEKRPAITVFSKPMKSKRAGEYYSVKAIYDDEECLLSFEEASRLHIAKTWPLMLFPLTFTVIFALLFAGTIIVGRNPSRYSKRIVRLLFKDGYIKY
jgi:hypothetical protein